MAGWLNDEQRSMYVRDGVVFPLSVLTGAEVTRYRSACEELETLLGGRPRTVEVRQMHLHFPWACELATHPRILHAVESLLGPDLLVWTTELFVKHPRDKSVAVGWHRDQPYMGFDPAQVTTAWIALSPSTRENGCMQIQTDDGETIDVTLAAGEMSLHTATVLHGSLPNLADEKRVGFVARYVTPEARSPGEPPPVLVARGTPRGGHFQIVDPPPETANEQAVDDMKRSAARHLEAMLSNLRRTGS